MKAFSRQRDTRLPVHNMGRASSVPGHTLAYTHTHTSRTQAHTHTPHTHTHTQTHTHLTHTHTHTHTHTQHHTTTQTHTHTHPHTHTHTHTLISWLCCPKQVLCFLLCHCAEVYNGSRAESEDLKQYSERRSKNSTLNQHSSLTLDEDNNASLCNNPELDR